MADNSDGKDRLPADVAPGEFKRRSRLSDGMSIRLVAPTLWACATIVACGPTAEQKAGGTYRSRDGRVWEREGAAGKWIQLGADTAQTTR